MPDDAKSFTLEEVARLARRSYSWAWDRAADGRLTRCGKDGRRILVTASSVTKALAANRAASGSRPLLYLVVDNTK